MVVLQLLALVRLSSSTTDKDDKAREVLLELRGLKADVSGEIQSYRAFNQQQGSEGGAWRQLLKRDVLKNLAVVSSLFILVTFTGR